MTPNRLEEHVRELEAELAAVRARVKELEAIVGWRVDEKEAPSPAVNAHVEGADVEETPP